MGKNTVIKFSFFILTFIVSCGAWYSVDAAINSPGSSIWLAPTIWFALLFVILVLGIMLIKEYYLTGLLAFVSLSASLFFAPAPAQILVVILALLLLLLAIHNIHNDLTLSIRINAWKTLRSGSTIIIFAFALAIAGQYYNGIKNSNAGRIIPKFKMTGLTSALTGKVLSFINPEFKNFSDENMTVDQLILKTQKDQAGGQEVDPTVADAQLDAAITAQYGAQISPQQRQAIKAEYQQKAAAMQSQLSASDQELILQQGRKQIGDMTGTLITGNEKVADVFSDMINNRINSYVAPNLSGQNLPVLPIIMAFILFLTIASLGSFISPLLVLLADLAFMLLVKAGVVTIGTEMREVETIA